MSDPTRSALEHAESNDRERELARAIGHTTDAYVVVRADGFVDAVAGVLARYRVELEAQFGEQARARIASTQELLGRVAAAERKLDNCRAHMRTLEAQLRDKGAT